MLRDDDPSRDLLCGLLALQTGLINQAQLVAAFHAWTQAKDRPMAEILAEQGALTASCVALVEGLVVEHLRRHGADPERSLAALGVGRSTRLCLAQIGDPQIDASLAHVGSRSSQNDADFDRTATYSVGAATSDGQRFRVLRPHAQGGLGAVFVALDAELHREVALKQILHHHADDPISRQRFLVEAEITGGLEHPGVVPVYGLGSYGDGRPYYAMRFIQGDSLKQAIERFHADDRLKKSPGGRSLELHKLLRRFTDVCNAIDYAHSRGVLHRDIKPGNVIVGKYGETLVVDWGLAKAVGRADPGSSPEERTLMPSSSSSLAETLPGSALGTPAYMSPEQARGELDRLGPRSDVYSLGATLYCLLTGKAPFQGDDVGAVLRAVQQGDFPAPRALDPSIEPALEAVCLKAMATGPEDRYATPRALADDIERWIADEPVTARRAPWAERARRWMRRRRTAVTAAAAALVVATVGLASVLAVQAQANGKLRKSNRLLIESVRRETKANADLRLSNTLLDQQRQRAEDRETQAIDAVKRFRDAVADNPELKNNPGLDDLRKTLLKEPLAFFRALRDRLQADRDTRPESLARLANAGFELGALTSEIGETQDALAAFQESLAIWEKLADADPTSIRYQTGQASSLGRIGALLESIGQPAEALKMTEAARAIDQKLADANPLDMHLQHKLAGGMHNLALTLETLGRTSEALELLMQARSISEKVVKADPTNTPYRVYLANHQHHIGELLRDTGQLVEAIKAHQAERAIRQVLADTNPTNAEFQGQLASSHQSIGTLMELTGQPTEAMSAYEAAQAIWQKAADSNPTVTRLQSDLAVARNKFGSLLSDTGRLAEAMKEFEAARAIGQKLVDMHPGVTQFQGILATSQRQIGALLSETGKPAEARERLEAALALLQRKADANPANPKFARNLALGHQGLGELMLGTGRPAEALKAFEAALTIQQRLADAQPAVPRFQMDLAGSHHDLGRLLTATGRTAEALKAYEKAVSIQQRLTVADPSVTAYQSDLARSHVDLGALLSATGRTAEGLKAYEKAVSIWRRLADAHPSVTGYQSDLARSLDNLGNLLSAIGRAAEALKSHELAVSIQQRLADAQPAVTTYQRDLASSYHNLGTVLSATGRPAEAQRAYEKARVNFQNLASANPIVTHYQEGLASCHQNVGDAMIAAGRPADALNAFESARAIYQKLSDANPALIQFQNGLVRSHNGIGLALHMTGKPFEATAAFQNALLIQEKLARGHPEMPDFASALGGILSNLAMIDEKAKRFEQARARLRKAIDWQRKALAANSKNPKYRQFLINHFSILSRVAQALGRGDEVAEAQHALEELRPIDPRISALDARLAAVLKGDAPKANDERLALAQRAYDKALYACAARFWGEALAAKPKLADDRQAQHRYNAACAAALAASGKGKDNPEPDEATKGKLRQQAHDWLRAELAAWTKLLSSGPPETRAFIAETLKHWQKDADLAGIRDREALAKLPDADRKAWQSLWVEVEALAKQAGESTRVNPSWRAKPTRLIDPQRVT